nr:unnamed protein product [Callosobruchus analis]
MGSSKSKHQDLTENGAVNSNFIVTQEKYMLPGMLDSAIPHLNPVGAAVCPQAVPDPRERSETSNEA